jgi:hypothetical protein
MMGLEVNVLTASRATENYNIRSKNKFFSHIDTMNPKPPLSLANVPFYLLDKWLDRPHHYSGRGDEG